MKIATDAVVTSKPIHSARRQNGCRPSSGNGRCADAAQLCGTPVVMLSSKDGLFDRARGRMVGSDQYLTKPFTKDSLLKAVGSHVKKN